MSDMPSIETELAYLRAENARLRAVNDQDQGPVRILPPENFAVMPTKTEMRELLDTVVTRWPGDFANVEPDAFAAAFRALATIHRQQELDHSHTAGHWVALSNSRLHGQGTTSYWPFLAAVVAWADIPVTDWALKNEGVPLEFGLNEFVGRLPRDEWRRTLHGEWTKPIDPRPVQHKASPRPNILLDGRPLPDQVRYQGPAYWNDF